MSQNNDYFLIECINDINICIKRPLQQTLRIKFTTFDASLNYLIFGATSGGIYVFSRNNFEFLKLVPSKEGAILKLLICPEQKYILVATSKGFVVLVENCFSDTKIRYQLFNEHEGNTITDIIWHYNEIYCGDNKGKVSVISLSSLLSKAIFQTPTATLMQLDSAIFQLDACGKYLLVSTKNKTFLCDTEAEAYRQIGKKLRDGDFGACFFAERPQEFCKNSEKEKNRFKFLRDDETFSFSASFDNAKIYCTRPGFRLWEADFTAAVVCTYQFKTALHENQTESICLDNDANSHLKTRKTVLNHFDNFGRLQLVLGKFLLTYCNNNLVVFDKQGMQLVFVYEMRDVKDVKVVQNYLYVWNKKDMRVIALMDLEFLLLKVLSSKQYVLCIELCLKYNQGVLKLLEVNEILRSLIILKDKCKSTDELKSLETIFSFIEHTKDFTTREHNTCTVGKKQIVTVENGHIEQPSCSYSNKNTKHPKLNNKSTKNLNSNHHSTNFTSNIIHPSSNNQSTSPKEDFKQPIEDINYINNILYKQYQVNQLYNNIETAQLYELLSSKENLDDVVNLFEGFILHVRVNGLEKDNNNVRYWCYSQYIKYVNNHHDCVKTLDIDSMALKTIFEAFNYIHQISKGDSKRPTVCDCKFPLPLVEQSHEYFQLAKDIYYKLAIADREQLLLSVPLLWKLRIPEMKDPLPLIMQLADMTLFKEQSECLTFDNWNDCVTLLVKLKRGHCLNCERKIEPQRVFNWREFALIMLKRIGGLDTTKILKKHARCIPNTELGYEFYQSCLFSAVSRENGKTCDFMANVLTSSMLENQFEDGLKQYLSQKYLGIKDSVDMLMPVGVDRGGMKCTLCHLLVQNAILEASTRLSCGHLFHKLCLESVNGICSICVQVPI